MRKGYFIQTVKVGIFAILAILLVTSLIFYIGSRKQTFGTKKRVSVTFSNVSGLKKGNAIRFAGVIIGSVDNIEIVSDTSVLVTLVIDTRDSRFVKKDSRVSISTEGLLGSKYLSVAPGSPDAPTIEDGDRLPSVEPVDFDQMLTSLNDTGTNLKNITGSVDKITNRINAGEGLLGAIIADKKMTENVNEVISSFRNTGYKASRLTGKMIEAVDTLKTAGENTVRISEELKDFTQKLNNDSSTLGKFIGDTIMANQITTTLSELQSTSEDVKKTSTSVRNSWVVRLFSKKDKKEKKKK